ncbi:MAG: hypothetical protein ABJF01_24505 [bacterium]
MIATQLNARIFIRLLATAWIVTLADRARLGAQAPAAQPPLPAYRHRVLGVFDEQSGDPVEGVEITDILSKLTALTTKTGTVSLVFLPDGGAMVRIRKVGYQPITMPVAISAIDTVPVTIMLSAAVTSLPAVVSRESAPVYRSPKLREFEARRKLGFGHFIPEADLRKFDNGPMQNALRGIPGMMVACNRGSCVAMGSRALNKCPVGVYIDGTLSVERDLTRFNVNDYAGVEFYAGGPSLPIEYTTGKSACGALLLWTRER